MKSLDPMHWGQFCALYYTLARKLYPYGTRIHFFDFPTGIRCFKWGTRNEKDGCAVVLSNAGMGENRMYFWGGT